MEVSFPFLLAAAVAFVNRTLAELCNLEVIYSNEGEQDEVVISLRKVITPYRKVLGVFDTICTQSNAAEDFLRDRLTCRHFIPI